MMSRGDKGASCPITLLLIIANVLCFLWEMKLGGSEDSEVLLDMGASFTPLILEGQIYRLFTCMFLHFGISHLMNNLLSLGAVGSFLEPKIGSVRFLIVYLAGGLFGNVASFVWEYLTDDWTVSVGASGGIFALFGALSMMVLFERQRMREISIPRLAIALLLMTIGSVSEANINAVAHIGGFVGGGGCYLLVERFGG